ncbi:alpha/beta hydrolase [Nocardioides sp. cx-169]|uniref:alpha/beta fold hydrolase n=1 Tax=Nocardioides sp. cx-169 TaxID=2899080 RepID=UPI001E4A5AAC|nr:alpha/beta hydrolase [Nocardioides sp. cx-169]MCD4535537.1 alpha/beta hydrolase [Nocardioides sp. cx-169]
MRRRRARDYAGDPLPIGLPLENSRLVAVPGLGLGVEAWRPTLSYWGAGDGNVLVLPGYGVPLSRRAPCAPVDVAVQLSGALNGPTTLLGHSSSCQVVAHAARLRPDLVDGLVLVGPTTDPRAASWWALATLWLRTAGHEDPRQLPSLLRQYRRTTLGSMLRTMDQSRRDDLGATLSEVHCPMVLVRGAHDRIARSDWLRSLGGSAPNRTVIELAVGAHMVPMTHPAELAASVGAVLGDRPSAGA